MKGRRAENHRAGIRKPEVFMYCRSRLCIQNACSVDRLRSDLRE